MSKGSPVQQVRPRNNGSPAVVPTRHHQWNRTLATFVATSRRSIVLRTLRRMVVVGDDAVFGAVDQVGDTTL